MSGYSALNQDYKFPNKKNNIDMDTGNKNSLNKLSSKF